MVCMQRRVDQGVPVHVLSSEEATLNQILRVTSPSEVDCQHVGVPQKVFIIRANSSYSQELTVGETFLYMLWVA